MNITSSLDSFTLLELFQLIDLGCKSGQLVVQIPTELKGFSVQTTYRLWFDKGKLVAIVNESGDSDLIATIEKKGWLKRRAVEKLENLCPAGLPLGTYLKNIGVLKAEQLQLLLLTKLEQIYPLFEMTFGKCQFAIAFNQIDNFQNLPWMSMTGVRVKARQVSVMALRQIKQWDQPHLIDRLPHKSSTLERIVVQPDFYLDPLEWLVWDRSNGKTNLETIAKQLHQSLANVQRAAFRLTIAGLVVEVSECQAKIRESMTPKAWLSASTLTRSLKAIASKQVLESKNNKSMMQNIIGFALLAILLV
jgi:Domain of unknown function (DUF4388)